VDPLHPIADRPPPLPAIPKVEGRRIESERRQPDPEQQRRRRREQRPDDAPPEDGEGHVDVRV